MANVHAIMENENKNFYTKTYKRSVCFPACINKNNIIYKTACSLDKKTLQLAFKYKTNI